MTVQAGIELDASIDWQVLEDSLESQACEFKQHGKHPQHPDNGPAEFYFKGMCTACKGVSPVSAICAAIADVIKSGTVMVCNKCQEDTTAVILLMEPIKP